MRAGSHHRFIPRARLLPVWANVANWAVAHRLEISPDVDTSPYSKVPLLSCWCCDRLRGAWSRNWSVREDSHGLQEPGGSATGGRQYGQDAAQFANRRLRLSGGGSRVHQLAGRAARLGRHLRALRPIPSHGEPVRSGPGRAQTALPSRDQLVQEFLRQPGEAICPMQP
jgi:hypothetical protein